MEAGGTSQWVFCRYQSLCTPTQLMTLVDALHAEHIGVFSIFVPVHFAVDAYGLASFDGTTSI
jgi:1,4-alpha-glucan branching enzyme